jgi:hypothetical protein
MDDRGPWIGHLTKPAQLEKKPLHLEWYLLLEPGLPTHAALFDLQTTVPELIAESEGGDETETLLSIWTTLVDRRASVQAIAFISDAYSRRADRRPERTASVNE